MMPIANGARATFVVAVRALARSAGAIAILATVLAMIPMQAGAQRVTAGAQFALAQYAEQGSALRFSGSGIAAHASLHWRRFGLHLGAASLAFDPGGEGGEGGSAESFDATQLDVRLRVRATRLVSVEAGVVDRDVAPLHAAQSITSMRLGALLTFPLAVGSDLAVRASYLGGSRFSGGGSAPFGVEVGLGVTHAPRWERVRLTGDLEFQRLDRRTETAGGTLSAPIQSTIARIGVMLVY